MAKITLWEVRQEKELKLEAIAAETGVSISELNRIENNRVSPSINTLEKIAKGMQCRISDLFESEYK